MLRSHTLAFAGLAALLASTSASQAQMRGEQCVPAVANPQMYENCRLLVVRTPDGLNEVCRCRILPQARRVIDRDDMTTGSVGVFAPPFVGPINGFTPRIRDGWTNPATGISSPRTNSRGGPRGADTAANAGRPGGQTGGGQTGGGQTGGGNAGGPGVADPQDPGTGSPGGRPGTTPPRGNNGVGNGQDPQPPGNPPVNDGPGTGPGNPGNKGGPSDAGAGPGGEGGQGKGGRGGGRGGKGGRD